MVIDDHRGSEESDRPIRGHRIRLVVTPDRGGSWDRLRADLPTVPIHEIVIHPRDNDMIIATHGRSLWILDDATPIQQAAEARATEAFLFDMRPAMQYNQANDRGFVTDKPFRGKNPTYGAPISYYLRTEPKQCGASNSGRRWQCDSRDQRQRRAQRAQGRHQPRAVGSPASAAAAPRCSRRAGGGGGGGGGFGGGGNNGPYVMPGEYRVDAGRRAARRSQPKRVRVIGDIRRADDRRRSEDVARHGAGGASSCRKTANEAADAVTELGRQFQALEGARQGRDECAG